MSCQTAQSFCIINGQTMDKNSLTFSFSAPNPDSKNNLIIPSYWNDILTALTQIHDYGALGTRNPSNQEDGGLDISSLVQNKNDIILINKYNDLVSLVSYPTLSKNDIIPGDIFSKLKDYINYTYTLNSDRCNTCNLACNSCNTCQGCNSCNTCEDCTWCTWCNACTGCTSCTCADGDWAGIQ